MAFKFFGPYEILAKIGQVAYQLNLPSSSSIHPVFHVSQLKHMAPGTQVISPLPSEVELPHVPVKVLQRRLKSKGIQSVPEVLVQWSGWPTELATLEDLARLQQSFPSAPAWGQADFQQPGDVSPIHSKVPVMRLVEAHGSPRRTRELLVKNGLCKPLRAFRLRAWPM